MKTTAEKLPSDSQGDGGSDGGAKAQPSDPSKISIASAKNITDDPRLWQIVLKGSSQFVDRVLSVFENLEITSLKAK
jgi:hypothetical protein